ncbi:FAD-dependent monooxygenase [Notoacmeibacter sp. MSK16QG-6]|uniref:FAD-dependent monooxygenase n=1 Tax=Notoacmeibacter sp. MSK16QG-6 TaxID=2957982 RepID=UPI00209D4A8C|nr:FAD-dependent monooxygenase [Notoacmeibacter sp. MSK16QG-6]MCP1198482.1 FAD-dependent monooxygenase [Notoacmeibacter sp. MSK16QG-6]
MEPPRSIIVAGAGIGGLTAALVLARQGRPVTIIERFEKPTEVGAGLQLSPNASRILFRLGLEGPLRDQSQRPEVIRLIAGGRGDAITELPLGERAEKRWGAPYLTIHRARLHAILWDAVEAEPQITIETGREVTGTATDAVGPRAIIRGPNGAEEERWGHLVVGADGVHSRVRTAMPKGLPPRYSGEIAFRAVLTGPDALKKAAAAGIDTECVSAFLAPSVHLVAYPLGGDRGINLVANTAGRDPGPSWSEVFSTVTAQWAISHISPALGELAGELDWLAWGLHAVAPRTPYVDTGGIALIGDAAHAMTPFAAQGAAMAVEDAAVLAHCVKGWREDRRAALLQYEAERRPRIARTRRRGAFNHFVWHAPFPISLGRDIVLRARDGESLLSDLDWLYGYDAGR